MKSDPHLFIGVQVAGGICEVRQGDGVMYVPVPVYTQIKIKIW